MLACIRRGQPEIRGTFSFLSHYLRSKDSSADPRDPLLWDRGRNTGRDRDRSRSQGRCPTGLCASPQSLLYNPSPFPASSSAHAATRLAQISRIAKLPQKLDPCSAFPRAGQGGRDSSRLSAVMARSCPAPRVPRARLPRQRSGRCSTLVYPPGLKERSDGRKTKTSPVAHTPIPFPPLPLERGCPLLAARRRGRGLTMTRPTRGRRRRTMRTTRSPVPPSAPALPSPFRRRHGPASPPVSSAARAAGPIGSGSVGAPLSPRGSGARFLLILGAAPGGDRRLRSAPPAPPPPPPARRALRPGLAGRGAAGTAAVPPAASRRGVCACACVCVCVCVCRV